MTIRKIIHVDMDAFFASVEQRDFPEYRGKALAVGATPQQRGVISAASYEARKFGVRSAMSSHQALRLCPHLILVRGRYAEYKKVSQQIRAIFAEYTDKIEPLSLDEAYLDVTENHLGITSATQIAKDIRQKIKERTGLTASAGVSYNKFLAKTASDFNKPDGLCVIPPEKAIAFIAELPIESFYGIGKKTAPKLKALNIHNGSDLQALSDAQWDEIFGSRSASFFQGLAHGIDNRPVETEWIRKSVGSEQTFSMDLSASKPNELERMMDELTAQAEELLGWLERNEMKASTLTLKVKYSDFQQITRSRTVSQPLETVDDVLHLAETLLQNTDVFTRPIRLIGLSLSRLEDRNATPDTAPHTSNEMHDTLQTTGTQQLQLSFSA